MPRGPAFDLVIVGMGTAGIVAAQVASRLGVRVAAVERDRVGGDCTWTGCVPSKALLASAKAAHRMRTAGDLGIEAVEPRIDGPRVLARARALSSRIAQTDDAPAEIRNGLGVELLTGRARLAGPHAVTVGDRTLDTRFVLLATGSRPVGRPGCLTTDDVWDLEDLPASLVILGAGPTALELAQAFRRLGTAVTVLERASRLLPGEEPELADRLMGVLRSEGVDLRLQAEPGPVGDEDGMKVVHARGERFAAEVVLDATGRRPDVEGLGLEEAGVEVGAGGVVVDDALRTTAPSVYAAGDLTGRWRFTHAAGHDAARAVRNMFFPGRDRDEPPMAWCTFTDPELAHAGLTGAQARERFGAGAVRVRRAGLDTSDRARTAGAEEGAIVVVTHRGRLVGAHVLADGAGELIGECSLAIAQGLKLGDLAGAVHPYPTLGTDLSGLGAQAALAAGEKLRFLVRTVT